MNRCIIYLCSLLLLPVLSNAQEELKTYWDDEQIKIKEVFTLKNEDSDILHGPYLSYYANGKLNVEGEYSNNTPSGIWTYYYENGNVKMSGPLLDNSNHGLWKFYFENGKLNMEGEIYASKKENKWIYYYENGNVKSEGRYENDQETGIWNHFYEDGTLKSQIYHRDKIGNYKEFYNSGKIKMRGRQIEGVSDSLWHFYFENGTLKAKGEYHHGERDGLWTFFHENGNKSAEGMYLEGNKHGKWSYYHENGILSSEGEERNGQKEGYWKLYNMEGNFKGEAVFNQGDGEYKEYYLTGELHVEGQVKQGKNYGKWNYYYKDGIHEGEANFMNGEGKFTGYYKDGTVKMKGRIEDGKNVGIWELYNQDGSLSGYYKPYYENDKPVFKIVETPALATNSEEPGDYTKPEYRFKNRRSKYFTPRVNEFRGFIIGLNPIAPSLGSLPIAMEYYIQERLGHELQYTHLRDPFFISNGQINLNEKFERGFSLAMRQKFYQADENFGMLYFGHEVRYTSLSHLANIQESQSNDVIREIGMDENRVEYSILVGDRWIKVFGENWMKNASKSGITLDIFMGLGIGWRKSEKNYPENSAHDQIFKDVSTGSITIPFRFGVNLGYVF